jgi:hypothetical protein
VKFSKQNKIPVAKQENKLKDRKDQKVRLKAKLSCLNSGDYGDLPIDEKERGIRS